MGMTTSRIFHINSSLRTTGTCHDFMYKLELGNQTYDKVVVTQALIPQTYYIVREGEYLTLIENGVSTRIDIPKGNYK